VLAARLTARILGSGDTLRISSSVWTDTRLDLAAKLPATHLTNVFNPALPCTKDDGSVDLGGIFAQLPIALLTSAVNCE
jgi:hypothetical protein